MYIWQRPDWPHLTWDNAKLVAPLAHARHQQGLLLGKMRALGFPLKAEAALQTLTHDVVKTSEIEGEQLDAVQVRSSIARKLGLNIAGLVASPRDVDGIVDMMLDATRGYTRPLTKKRLLGWHESLFPEGRSGMAKIAVGVWRRASADPMEVVSGALGRERVHFVAPPAARLDPEIKAFLSWFSATDTTDAVLKAGIAHFWFVTIHPFEDGNGRIARAIADMALARSENSDQRFYSMSAQIRREREEYYAVLESAQKGGADITQWLMWFLACMSRALDGAEKALGDVLQKAAFWDRHTALSFNDRQRKLLNRLLDGFEGKMTTTKWAKLAKCSQDTAYRDIVDLVERGVLMKDEAGGRSTGYGITPTSGRGK